MTCKEPHRFRKVKNFGTKVRITCVECGLVKRRSRVRPEEQRPVLGFSDMGKEEVLTWAYANMVDVETKEDTENNFTV